MHAPSLQHCEASTPMASTSSSSKASQRKGSGLPSWIVCGVPHPRPVPNAHLVTQYAGCGASLADVSSSPTRSGSATHDHLAVVGHAHSLPGIRYGREESGKQLDCYRLGGQPRLTHSSILRQAGEGQEEDLLGGCQADAGDHRAAMRMPPRLASVTAAVDQEKVGVV